jgi:hypothetical protein
VSIFIYINNTLVALISIKVYTEMSHLNIHLKLFLEATSDSTVVNLSRGLNLKTANKKHGVWEKTMYFALHTHTHIYIHAYRVHTYTGQCCRYSE